MKKFLYALGAFIALCAVISRCEKNSADTIEAQDSTVVEADAPKEEVAVTKTNKEKSKATVEKLKNKFREKNDEFENETWIFHKSTPKYRNTNSVHLYFLKNTFSASNLRFCVQYYSNDWLFIESIIFNIDGDNYTFIPYNMKRDNNHKIWEWCDDPASNNMELVRRIANATSVKIKFNGQQYYDTRTMSKAQIAAFKETLEYYEAMSNL